jgi:hypothetical protein
MIPFGSCTCQASQHTCQTQSVYNSNLYKNWRATLPVEAIRGSGPKEAQNRDVKIHKALFAFRKGFQRLAALCDGAEWPRSSRQKTAERIEDHEAVGRLSNPSKKPKVEADKCFFVEARRPAERWAEVTATLVHPRSKIQTNTP